MSILSTLLNTDKESISVFVKSLPKGRLRTHKIDDGAAVITSAKKKKATDKHWKAKTTSPENVEAVYSVIAAGASTVKEMQCATVLCKTTIWRAITQLESWHTGPRIERNDDNKPARFEICTPAKV